MPDRLNLTPHEIHFFFTVVDGINDDHLLKRYHSILSKSEKEKIERFFFKKDRHNCLVTRALLRFLLSSCTTLDPADFIFRENKYGKPEIMPGLTKLPVKFNISHSADVTACALTLESEIGIDIENVQREIDLGLVNRFFSISEIEDFKKKTRQDRQKFFFDLWTLKESYIKAKGKGLSMGLDTFSFNIGKQNIRVDSHGSSEDTSNQWQFFQFSPLKNYRAAISIRTALNPLKLHIHKCIPFGSVASGGPVPVILSQSSNISSVVKTCS